MKCPALFVLLTVVAAMAQTPETGVLGGPCLREDPNSIAAIHSWHASVNAFSAAERRGELHEAVERAKDVVRGRCSNEHWWLKLAETLVRADRPAEAVAALKAFYDRRSNAVDRRLRDPESPLHSLLEIDVYRNSSLAESLARDRRALEQRRAKGRELLAAEERPMLHWIAKGACPFECCHYGTWSVREDVDLYDSPGGFSVVAKVKSGRTVQALTGEVRLRPLPAIVRYTRPYGLELEQGTLIYILDYMGEGHGRVLANGKVGESHILSVQEHCPFPDGSCWAEFIDPDDAGRQREFTWWVQIRISDGSVGWTQEVGSFGGMDACG